MGLQQQMAFCVLSEGHALDKRVKRGKLDREIADLAKALAKDLRSVAIADPEYANGDYPKDMQPDALIAAITKQQY